MVVVIFFPCPGKDIASRMPPEMTLAARASPVGGETSEDLGSYSNRTGGAGYWMGLLLHEKANRFENLIAHLNVAELRGMGELEFFPEPVKDSGIQIGPLVQQVQQFRGGGRVLIIRLDAAGVLDGDGQG
jgi:hypothetical protein